MIIALARSTSLQQRVFFKMINSEEHLKNVEWGSVKAGVSMHRLCNMAEVNPDTYRKMRKRVIDGGVISVKVINKLYATLQTMGADQ